jgi:hypothetical protein
MKNVNLANDPHIVKTTDENIKLGSIPSVSIDDLMGKPDEKDKIIIDLARENAKLRDCIIELNLQLLELKKENKK